MVRALLVVPILLIALSDPASAQSRWSTWVFGYEAEVVFDSAGPHSVPAGRTWTTEGVASISDPTTGELLFYTDGVTVWNRLDRPMPNGLGLAGHDNATQSALIVPLPGDDERYLIFTADAAPYRDPPNSGIHYSRVDMAADGGLGDVVEKNVELIPTAAEKLIAVHTCAPDDGYWVICHELETDAFVSVRVDAGGVGMPVRSHAGGRYTADVEQTDIGELKASADGSMLAAARWYQGRVELFDFDPAAGSVSNPRFIEMPEESRQVYGVSFSPDGTKLYASVVGGALHPNQEAILQYDLTPQDVAAIIASKYRVISRQVPGVNADYWGALQLGPDGRIYCAPDGKKWLDVVANPNAAGPACDFRQQVLFLDGRTRYGLPNVVTNELSAPSVRTSGDTNLCAGSSVEIAATGAATYRWFPADGLSCADCAAPTASPDATTTYTVVGSRADGCSATASVTVGVREGPSARLRIHGDHLLAPADNTVVPIVIEGELRTRALDFEIRYDTTCLLLDRVRRGAALGGNWALTQIAIERGMYRGRLECTDPAAVLQRSVLLLDLRGFIGRATSGYLTVEAASDAVECGELAPTSALMTIGPLCGVDQRLMIRGGARYSLQLHPDPVETHSTIRYSVGLDGPTVVTIFDADGRVVARPVDREVAPGEYEVPLDAAELGSGVYTCRLQQGSAVREIRFVVIR